MDDQDAVEPEAPPGGGGALLTGVSLAIVGGLLWIGSPLAGLVLCAAAGVPLLYGLVVRAVRAGLRRHDWEQARGRVE